MNTTLAGPCDAGVAHSIVPAPCPNATLTLATSILASSLAFIDGSVVNVALPAIGEGLGGEAADLQWVVNAYLLPLGALILFGGAVGDRYGRRRMLLTGILVFALASTACALAPSLPWLLAGRALQGIGATLLMPNSLAVLGAAFAGEARGRAIGTWAAVGAVAGALGPLLGGWLLDVAGWRTIFLVNLPIAAAALLLGFRGVAESRDPDARALDLPGAASVTLGIAALTYGLTLASAPGAPAGAGLTSAALGGAALLVFVVVEWRRGARAMMPVALFGTASFVGLTLLTFLLYGALGGLLVLLPYRLIVAGGYSGTAAGAALLPLPLIIGLASRFMGRLAARVGPRLPLSLGPLVVAVGFWLAADIDPGLGYAFGVLPALVVIALGMAGAVAPLTTAVMASVDARHTGTASGFNSAVARVGGLIATAVLGGGVRVGRARRGGSMSRGRGERVPAFAGRTKHGGALTVACLATFGERVVSRISTIGQGGVNETSARP